VAALVVALLDYRLALYAVALFVVAAVAWSLRGGHAWRWQRLMPESVLRWLRPTAPASSPAALARLHGRKYPGILRQLLHPRAYVPLLGVAMVALLIMLHGMSTSRSISGLGSASETSPVQGPDPQVEEAAAAHDVADYHASAAATWKQLLTQRQRAGAAVVGAFLVVAVLAVALGRRITAQASPGRKS
jgi:hypothetical protein